MFPLIIQLLIIAQTLSVVGRGSWSSTVHSSQYDPRPV